MDCKVPRALTFFFVGNVVIFLYLFSDFYRKAYKKPSNTDKKLIDTINNNNNNNNNIEKDICVKQKLN